MLTALIVAVGLAFLALAAWVVVSAAREITSARRETEEADKNIADRLRVIRGGARVTGHRFDPKGGRE